VGLATAGSVRRMAMLVAAALATGCGSGAKTVVSTTTTTATVTTTSTPSAGGLPIHTLADFVRFPRRVRELFAIHYLTSHPDPCYHGKPTPELVAANVASSLADYRPGYHAATGAYVRAGTPIGRALEKAKAEIGC
jgi:hypothetical protein